MTVDMQDPCCHYSFCNKLARWTVTTQEGGSARVCGVHLNMRAQQQYELNAEGSDAILVQRVWNP